MKHPFFSLLSASLLLGSLAVGTVVSAIPAAADGTSGDYTYEVDEETLKGYITGYTGKDKEITIPEELDGTVIAGISADTLWRKSPFRHPLQKSEKVLFTTATT